MTLLTAGGAAAQGNLPPAAVPATVKAVESNVARQGYFHVGGHYVGEPGKEVMTGQMYVEVWAPREVKHPWPIVFFHGASSTATTWMQTPDGRKGWAHLFVDMGYIVYLTDQPARGRSAYHASQQGRQIAANVAGTERNNTDLVHQGTWPQAKLHTQYPGEGADRGRRGNAVFDAGFARSVPYLASNAETQDLVQKAGTELLDRIGPAILVTHSQAGPFGWLLADARPQLVKAIVAVEPSGPPFENHINATGRARPWGPTEIRLTYDPPVADPAELRIERQAEPEAPNLVPCWMQAGTPRTLPNLRNIPITIITGEASYHAPYDHCTARYLTQAGVANEHVRLEQRGIHGNGHGIPSELNNVDTAKLVDAWLVAKLR
ncbi:alpha/beta hydrolase [Dankookia sp. P2]|uniref:alpha/beta hydrolase n=1 Tax=Dankookia sp. P2 TaxID=3423955 RepID=UPI003D67FDDD